MHDSIALLLEIGLLLVVLTILGALARRVSLSPIPLYLLTGLALGDGGIPLVPPAVDFIQTGALVGVILLLLTLGLEFTVGEFALSIRRHLPSAWVDLVLNATPGALVGWFLGLDFVGILAMAGITYVSSSGVVSRLLTNLRRLGNRETPAVLAVLVLEDFAMAAYLPLLAVLAAGGAWWYAVIGMAIAMAALAVAFVASYRWGHVVARLMAPEDSELMLLRVLGVALIVAGLAEYVHVSAAVGALLVGLTLTGESAERAREMLSPLRDLFAAIFFVSIGLMVEPASLIPMLPVAVVLALVTAATKVVSGMYAARREGVGWPGQLRAGTALIVRGEFSLVIIALVGQAVPMVEAIAMPYVFILAFLGPVATLLSGRIAPRRISPRVIRRVRNRQGRNDSG
ncbi:potassium transporter [Mycolicibacterium cyprinidarum]|uniref:Potassium transporter n=1 Tax=Mycolicibacterium cyprinidarum TaxID=2860311 RepID=A0ABQ4VDV9_9MYCO|nr:potassium transporter [Mycolicibacterium sp. NGTWS1803]GJF12836.1 potassium transporter [Mycolicibacterium sp. NGTWS0302]GJF14068.1 potassium transporter [Mycolicibacterium sp. NGTWSNA01]